MIILIIFLFYIINFKFEIIFHNKIIIIIILYLLYLYQHYFLNIYRKYNIK
jgi:hypothetical protein